MVLTRRPALLVVGTVDKVPLDILVELAHQAVVQAVAGLLVAGTLADQLRTCLLHERQRWHVLSLHTLLKQVLEAVAEAALL